MIPMTLARIWSTYTLTDTVQWNDIWSVGLERDAYTSTFMLIKNLELWRFGRYTEHLFDLVLMDVSKQIVLGVGKI